MPYSIEKPPSLLQKILGQTKPRLESIPPLLIFRDPTGRRGIIYPENEELVVSLPFSRGKRQQKKGKDFRVATKDCFGRKRELRFVWQPEELHD